MWGEIAAAVGVYATSQERRHGLSAHGFSKYYEQQMMRLEGGASPALQSRSGKCHSCGSYEFRLHKGITQCGFCRTPLVFHGDKRPVLGRGI